MMRRFKLGSDEWEARVIGGHAVAAGHIPERASHWTVLFRCISDPSKGEYTGEIGKPDPNDLSEHELREALEPQVKVMEALERRPEYVWRTVDGIAKDTGMDPDTVYEWLEHLDDRVVQSSVPDKQGRALYASRKRYRDSQGFFKQYWDILRSSTG